MLAKSIIAGTVLSLMAGGVVYFGTDVDAAAVKEKVAEKTAEMKAEISDKVMAGGKDEHPHGEKTETDKAETSVDMPSVKTASGKVIEARKPTISYTSASKDKKVKTVEVTNPEAPQKKWLNQYLKTDAPETETSVTEAEEATEEKITEEKADVAKELMESMGLTKDGSSDSDTGSFIVEDNNEELTEEQIEMAEAEGFEDRALETENIWAEDKPSETGRKSSTRKMLHDIIKKDRAVFMGKDKDGKEKTIDVKVMANEDGETTIETETIDMGDGKIMKIIKKTVNSESHDGDGKKMRIKVMKNIDGKGGLNADTIEGIMVMTLDDDASMAELLKNTKSKDISATVNVVMEQAEKIEMPELRDRAYLDLVSYGLQHGNYDVASKALTKIQQVELRDTARNRIAVAYAKDGNAEDAFGILDDIEVDALRDVMRLQVIEAMIAPDALPKDMQ